MDTGKCKIFDAELRLMKYIWESAPISATALVELAARDLHWKRNTTYTVLKRLAQRQIIRREDPGFLVTPLVSREEVAYAETQSLIGKLFDGSRSLFLANFLRKETMTAEELDQLREMVNRIED